MTAVILAHQGTVDKYMADGIMAFWNTPLDDVAHAEHAAALRSRCALSWPASTTHGRRKPSQRDDLSTKFTSGSVSIPVGALPATLDRTSASTIRYSATMPI
jgi:hypothetical protein